MDTFIVTHRIKDTRDSAVESLHNQNILWQWNVQQYNSLSSTTSFTDTLSFKHFEISRFLATAISLQIMPSFHEFGDFEWHM